MSYFQLTVDRALATARFDAACHCSFISSAFLDRSHLKPHAENARDIRDMRFSPPRSERVVLCVVENLDVDVVLGEDYDRLLRVLFLFRARFC